MDIKLSLGGVLFRFLSPRPRNIDPELEAFITDTPDEADVTVRLSWDWDNARLPSTPPVGEDAILRYYAEEDCRFCLVRGGPKGPVACTRYDTRYREMTCTFNDAPFLCPPRDLGSTLRFLPIREIFLHYRVLFLHASRVSCGGRALLFAAPSGTGKTTQARLWETHRGTPVVCNDRTLLRRSDGLWRAYAYPLDGSQPVRGTAVDPLAALVLLEQGSGNSAVRLSPAKALARLMRQVVLDCWSAESRTAAMELLLTFMEDVPVYLLTCTPDVRAVEALETRLREDEVIPLG